MNDSPASTHPEPTPNQQIEKQQSTQTAKNRTRKLTLIVAIALAITTIGANVWQLYTNQRIASQLASLTSQINRSKSDITTLTALNDGAVAPATASSLPANEIGLVSNKITFTLPKGWEQAPLASSPTVCTPGTIDAKPIVCDDITSVLPSALITTDPNTHYVYSPLTVDVSVFEHTDNTNAKDWLSTDYGEGLPNMGEPQAINQSSAPIHGYDGFTFTSKYSDTPYPATIFYAVVHGNYAVAIHATYMTTVNPTGTLGGNVNKDYSGYLSDIQALVDSITFHG